MNNWIKLMCLVGCFLVTTAAKGQGYNSGLGNEEEANLESLHSRVTNLEMRSKMFQVYLNSRGGFTEALNGDDKGGMFKLEHFRPEFLGTLGKIDYRVRLDLSGNHNNSANTGTNNVINILRVFYKPNQHCAFSFGKSALNYGTFEWEWNPVHVLRTSEFQSRMTGSNTLSARAEWKNRHHSLTGEIANNTNNTFATDFPIDSKRFAKTSYPLQYTATWRGNMVDNRLKTICSYTFNHFAKDCSSNLLMLGASLNIGKWEAQLDYSGAFGKVDYLGVATEDARKAQRCADESTVTDTRYQQLLVDVGYKPTQRWNLFVKAGVNNCSATSDEALRNYRQSYEYQAAAQYFLDKNQDVRISLGYFGKTVHYKEGFGLQDFSDHAVKISLITRLKVL